MRGFCYIHLVVIIMFFFLFNTSCTRVQETKYQFSLENKLDQILTVEISKFGEEVKGSIIDYPILFDGKSGEDVFKQIEIVNKSNRELEIRAIQNSHRDSLFFANMIPEILPARSIKMVEIYLDNKTVRELKRSNNKQEVFHLVICEKSSQNCRIGLNLQPSYEKRTNYPKWKDTLKFIGLILLVLLTLLLVYLFVTDLRRTDKVNRLRFFFNFSKFHEEWSQFDKKNKLLSSGNIALQNKLKEAKEENEIKKEEVELLESKNKELNTKIEITELENSKLLKYTEEMQSKISYYEINQEKDQAALKKIVKNLNVILTSRINSVIGLSDLNEEIENTIEYVNRSRVDDMKTKIAKGKVAQVLQELQKNRDFLSLKQQNDLIVISHDWSTYKQNENRDNGKADTQTSNRIIEKLLVLLGEIDEIE